MATKNKMRAKVGVVTGEANELAMLRIRSN
jgi:hypothetical protein